MLWGYGCASHPPVLAKEPRKGETDMGFSFSADDLLNKVNNKTSLVIIKYYELD